MQLAHLYAFILDLNTAHERLVGAQAIEIED